MDPPAGVLLQHQRLSNNGVGAFTQLKLMPTAASSAKNTANDSISWARLTPLRQVGTSPFTAVARWE